MYRISVLTSDNRVVQSNVCLSERQAGVIAMRLLASPQVDDVEVEYVPLVVEDEDINKLVDSLTDW